MPNVTSQERLRRRDFSAFETGIAAEVGWKKRRRFDVAFVLGPHTSPADAERAGSLFGDINLLEGTVPVGTNQLLKGVADGAISPSQAIASAGGALSSPGNYLDTIVQEIGKHGKRKAFLFCDLESGDPLYTEELLPMVDMFQNWARLNFENPVPLSEALQRYARFMADYTDIHRLREDKILEMIRPRVVEAILANPELALKNKIILRGFFGTMHRGLSQKMRSTHPETTRVMPQSPYSFFTNDHVIRLGLQGKTPSPGLLRQGLMELLVQPFLGEILSSSGSISEQARIVRNFLEKFSPRDLEHFYTVFILRRDFEGAKALLVSKNV